VPGRAPLSDLVTVPDGKGLLSAARGDDHVICRWAPVRVLETGDHNQPARCVCPDFGVGGQPALENCLPPGHVVRHSCHIDCRTISDGRRSRSHVREVVPRTNTSTPHRVHHNEHRSLTTSAQRDSHIRYPVRGLESRWCNLSIFRAQRPERYLQSDRWHRELVTNRRGRDGGRNRGWRRRWRSRWRRGNDRVLRHCLSIHGACRRCTSRRRIGCALERDDPSDPRDSQTGSRSGPQQHHRDGGAFAPPSLWLSKTQ
jgi:hypothetical protein